MSDELKEQKPEKKKLANLKQRSITAVFLFAILIPVIFFGGLFIEVICGVMAILATYELEHMYKGEEKWSYSGIQAIILSGLTYASIVYAILSQKWFILIITSLVLFLVIGISSIIDSKEDIHMIGRHLLSVLYPVIGFSALAMVRNIPACYYYQDQFITITHISEPKYYLNGVLLLVYTALVCIMTDNFAYVFGTKFGKNKLAPVTSPHKTWEGSIWGSVFGTVIPTFLVMFTNLKYVLFPKVYNVFFQILLTVAFSLVLSIIEQFGDLFASKLKRGYGLKDYSNLLPGHGGILDRFDSYIFASVFVFVWVMTINNYWSFFLTL